jgi:hypothetical protein
MAVAAVRAGQKTSALRTSRLLDARSARPSGRRAEERLRPYERSVEDAELEAVEVRFGF